MCGHYRCTFQPSFYMIRYDFQHQIIQVGFFKENPIERSAATAADDYDNDDVSQ